jgi:hypothetical protein
MSNIRFRCRGLNKDGRLGRLMHDDHDPQCMDINKVN